jgi:DNA-binding Lrp family transcriptional regulator
MLFLNARKGILNKLINQLDAVVLTPMKDKEKKIILELAKNNRRSDRQLSKFTKMSQPTASRIRSSLENEGYIRQYLALPDFIKLGITITAITMVKIDSSSHTKIEESTKHILEQARMFPEVFLASAGGGLGFDIAIISLHSTFQTYEKFKLELKKQITPFALEVTPFLIDLSQDQETFDFKSIAEAFLKQPKKDP